MSFLGTWKLRWTALVALVTVAAGAVLYAQIEGEDRGVAPIASTGDFEVSGVKVEASGDTPEEARKKAWEEAQRLGWQKLYARTHGGAQTAPLADSTLNDIVSAIVIEQEQIGPKRYIATLGVLFDRARTGSILGLGGDRLRSPPMLLLPIQISGGVRQVFETRTEWQKAWARYNAGDSAIDYVRPYGSGADSLLLTAGQAQRRNRVWWRMILDQFGAADVVIPQARLIRQWPGGPITGQFSARYGPDNRYIGGFVLQSRSGEDLAQMLDRAVQRMDQLFVSALSQGILRPDRSLTFDDQVEVTDAELERLLAEEAELKANGPRPQSEESQNASSGETAPSAPAALISVSIQFDAADAAAVNRAESAVRGISGVASAATTSLALGGVSVMRVLYRGDLAVLAAALRARGWQVTEGAGALRIRRSGDSAPAPVPDNGGT